MCPVLEGLSCHSSVLKLVPVLQGCNFLFSLSQAVVATSLCTCPPRGGVAAWLLPHQRRQDQLVLGGASFLSSTLQFFSLFAPACLSSTSLFSWLREGEGGAEVTRLFLNSLPFGGVPLFGQSTITHIITAHTPNCHSSFQAQHRIVIRLVTS